MPETHALAAAGRAYSGLHSSLEPTPVQKQKLIKRQLNSPLPSPLGNCSCVALLTYIPVGIPEGEGTHCPSDFMQMPKPFADI